MSPNRRTPSPSPGPTLHFAVAALPFVGVLVLLVPAVHTGFACLSSPCVYGICLDDLNSTFTCYCMDGYTGTLCQTNWDDCWSSPCQNGGTCTDGVASFNCTCPEGFTGELCELNVNECLSNPCLNNATCLDGDNSYMCLCEPGYYGQRCEMDMAVCNMTDGEPRCHNGGLCRDGPGAAFYCDCAPGWTGKICDDPIDECASNPCQHGGVCIDLHNNFACACLFGYTGNDCSLVLEPCRSNVCENGALCLLEGGDRQHVCYCVPDFHGPRCQYRYDECLAGPGCRNGGSCIDGVDDFSCACPPRLTGGRCECLATSTGDLDCGYEAPSTSTLSTFPWGVNATRDGKGHTFPVGTELSSPIPETTQSIHSTSRIIPSSSESPISLFTTEESTMPSFHSTGSHPDVSVFLWTTSPSYPVTEVSGKVSPSTLELTTSSEFSSLDLTTEESSHGTDSGIHLTDTGIISQTGTISPGVETSTSPGVSLTQETPKPTVVTGEVTLSGTSSLITEVTEASISPSVPELRSTTSGLPEVPGSPSSINVTSPEVPPSKVPVSPSEAHTSPVTSSSEAVPISTYVTSPSEVSVSSEIPISPPHGSPSSPVPSVPQGTATASESQNASREVTMQSSITTEIVTLEITRHEVTASIPVEPITQQTTETSMMLTTTSLPEPTTYTSSSIVTYSSQNESAVTTATTDFGTTPGDLGTRIPVPTTMTTATTGTPKVTNVTTNVTTKASSSSTSTTTTSSTITLEGGKTPVKTTTAPSVYSTDSGWSTYTSESTIWVNGTDIPFTGDCAELPCLHGSTCVYTGDGVKCECVFGWAGPTCGERAEINVPAFNGHSFLAHLLPNASVASGLSIGFVARTLASNGLLVHASLSPDVYMSAYLEDGLLRFQFSCGIQTMLFNELQKRVDDGHDLVVNVSNADYESDSSLSLWPSLCHRLSVRPVVALQTSATSPVKTLTLNARLCVASLRVNHTLAMSGEQTAVLGTVPKGVSAGVLLLGGLPLSGSRSATMVEPLPDPPLPGGFSGCVHDLQVNGRPRHVYKDAIDGAEITECSSLACLSSPCHSGASCAQSAEGWTCLCPSGMVGRRCDRPVCANNPCLFGGTCVSFPVSGFLCLCPLGKRGMFCEYDLEISTPQFSSTVGGLSSFAAYVIPTPVDWNMELRMRFLPTTTEQVALLLFVGQTGQHGPTSDHLALSYIKGYVILTWNLGSGVRRIFTPHPVHRPPSGRPHDVRIGRVGRTAWLQVDRMENISGVAPGPLDRLNVRPLLYVGGHGSVNFSQLPHDLPFHHGFLGCVSSIELVAGSARLPLAGSGDGAIAGSSSGAPAASAVAGRAVGQCGTAVCSANACKHGICMQHGPAFTCLCQDGWFGPTCADRQNPCDEERNACSEGSTCVPTPNGYECDCRLGRSGRYCEQEEQLSDVYLSGRRSFLEVAAVDVQRSSVCLQLEIRPSQHDGLVLLVGHPFPDAPFMALSLRKSVLVATLSSARSWPLTLRSAGVVGNHAVWHLVRLCRFGRRLTLSVDGAATSVILRPGDRLPSQGAPLFIGGLPDMSTLPIAGAETPFKGCVRRLSQNGRPLPLDVQHLVDARNAVDCDGTRCGGDICYNGGTCSLRDAPGGSTAVCSCLQEYTGSRCETQLRCPFLTCKNGGRCVQRTGEPGECHCPLQWTGPLCAQRSTIGTPLHFPGNGYLLVRSGDSTGRQRKTRGHEDESANSIVKSPLGFVSLNYSTISEDGMILWTEENDQWLGVGLRQNNLTVLWGWKEQSVGELADGLEIESPTDGSWVTVTVQLGPERVSIWRNDNGTSSDYNASPSPLSSPPPLPTEELSPPLASRPAPYRRFATDGVFFIGGFPGNRTVTASTKGAFSSAFIGCVASFRWGGTSVLSDLSTAEGENVGACNNVQPWDWH